MPATAKRTTTRSTKTAATRVRKPARNKPTRPLSCHNCGATGDGLVVGRGQHKRRVRGVERTFVDVTCKTRDCQNEFGSVHPEALAIAKAADAAAKATAGPQTEAS